MTMNDFERSTASVPDQLRKVLHTGIHDRGLALGVLEALHRIGGALGEVFLQKLGDDPAWDESFRSRLSFALQDPGESLPGAIDSTNGHQ